MKTKSEVFSRFLSLNIGTERIVKLRRLVFNKYIKCIMFHYANIPLDVIGSKSEGLDMSGSDTDIICRLDVTALEKGYSSNDTKCIWKYDSLNKDIHPGYVMLETDTNEIVSSHEILKNVLQYEMNDPLAKEQHGPAITRTSLSEDHDYVIGVQSEYWPKIAIEWIHRKRNYGWPSQEMINSIVQKGCYIVPIGSSRSHTVDDDWRLSFCLAEKELVETFNHTQLLVYGVLKVIQKEIIDTNNVQPLLCSYFLKTVIFWVVEETSFSFWTPQNILCCLHLCVERLLQFVINKNCPNYFVKGNNMFRKRFNASQKEVLVQKLWVLKIKTLNRFPYYIMKQNLNIDMLDHLINQKEELNIFRLLFMIGRLCRNMACTILSKILPINKSVLSTVKKVPILRKEFDSMLCHFIASDNKTIGNKKRYKLLYLQMKLLTENSTNNLVSGKAWLASCFYMQGKYHECLQVTDIVSDNLYVCMFHNGQKIMKTDLFKNVLNCVSDATEIRYFSSYDIIIPFKSSLLVKEISEEFSTQLLQINNKYKYSTFNICPRLYIYFLRCLCYFRLGDTQRYENEYEKMKSVCDTYCGSFSPMHNTNAFFLKIIFNKIRHNITFDQQNSFDASRVIIKHTTELDFTIDDISENEENINEHFFSTGLSSKYINDIMSVGGEP
ncbi:uncharacterized protein LOC143054942 [Mytilus galloprovincialis]|uniref:uncharacterized protein LOC143054942 n=1 Tax=Mytilus galloprovincialis TaxID=29158 RepID=UPI003F7BCBE6